MIHIILLTVYAVGWLLSTIGLTILRTTSGNDLSLAEILLNGLIAILWPITIPVILFAIGSTTL